MGIMTSVASLIFGSGNLMIRGTTTTGESVLLAHHVVGTSPDFTKGEINIIMRYYAVMSRGHSQGDMILDTMEVVEFKVNKRRTFKKWFFDLFNMTVPS